MFVWDVHCIGAYGSCDAATCLETYNIVTEAQNGGAACTAADGDTQECTDTSLCSTWFFRSTFSPEQLQYTST